MMWHPFGVNVDVAPLRGTVLFVVPYIPGDTHRAMMCHPFGVNVDVAPLRGTGLFVVLYIPGDTHRAMMCHPFGVSNPRISICLPAPQRGATS